MRRGLTKNNVQAQRRRRQQQIGKTFYNSSNYEYGNKYCRTGKRFQKFCVCNVHAARWSAQARTLFYCIHRVTINLYPSEWLPFASLLLSFIAFATITNIILRLECDSTFLFSNATDILMSCSMVCRTLKCAIMWIVCRTQRIKV